MLIINEKFSFKILFIFCLNFNKFNRLPRHRLFLPHHRRRHPRRRRPRRRQPLAHLVTQ